jgi:transcriptional regulator with XRE-family HTH domain
MERLGRWAKEGGEMRRLREKRGLTRRRVEDETLRLARAIGIEGSHVSEAYLRDIEDGHCVPGLLKLVSLARVYKRRPERLIDFYEVIPEEEHVFASFPSSAGSVLNPAIDKAEERNVLWKVARQFSLRATRVLPPSELRGAIPDSWRESLGGEQICFAVVGSGDDKMGKILRPDSLVAVDTRQKVIDESEAWATDEERPVYLCLTEEGHVCRWVYQVRDMLTLLPYSANSKRPAESYRTPSKAEIIGRVICTWRLPAAGVALADRFTGEAVENGTSR